MVLRQNKQNKRQLKAWMEYKLLIHVSLKRCALSMEDKMAAGVLGTLGIMVASTPQVIAFLHDHSEVQVFLFWGKGTVQVLR